MQILPLGRNNLMHWYMLRFSVLESSSAKKNLGALVGIKLTNAALQQRSTVSWVVSSWREAKLPFVQHW